MAVFSLQEVKKLQVQNINDNDFASWPEILNYGYFVGGGGGSQCSVVRIEFSNETASAPNYWNVLSIGRYRLTGTSSNSYIKNSNYYGYFGGGYQYPPVHHSIVERIDFTNETGSTPGNNLTQARQALTSTSSDSYAYFGGGRSSGATRTTVDRIDFSTETTSAPGNNLTQQRDQLAAISSSSYGYFGCGELSPLTRVATVDRIDFSTETTSAPGNNLTEARRGVSAVSSDSYGYFGGGNYTSGIDTVDRIDFSNETTSAPGNDLPQARGLSAAVSNKSYGYFAAGLAPSPSSIIDRIDFSNETFSVPGNPLTLYKFSLAGVAGGTSVNQTNGHKTYGYSLGGYNGGAISVVRRLDMTTDSTSTLPALLNDGLRTCKGIQNNHYGYVVGGFGPFPGGNTHTLTMNRIDFSNDSITNSTIPFSTIRTTLWTVDGSYGWKGGDTTIQNNTTSFDVKRLDYQTESWSLPGTYLSDRGGSGGTFSSKSNSYGYHLAGFGAVPTVNYYPRTLLKYDTRSDTASFTLNVAPASKYVTTSVQSSQFGYYGGGVATPPFNNTCNIRRLEFSTETESDSGAFCHSHNDGTGMESKYYGYIGQGDTPTNPPFPFTSSTIRRLEFSTNTPSSISNMDGGGTGAGAASLQNGI